MKNKEIPVGIRGAYSSASKASLHKLEREVVDGWRQLSEKNLAHKKYLCFITGSDFSFRELLCSGTDLQPPPIFPTVSAVPL